MADELSHKLAFLNLAHLVHSNDKYGDLMPKTFSVLRDANIANSVGFVSRVIKNSAKENDPQFLNKVYRFMHTNSFVDAYRKGADTELSPEHREIFNDSRDILKHIPADAAMNAKLFDAIRLDLGNFEMASKDVEKLKPHVEAMQSHVSTLGQAMKQQMFRHKLFGEADLPFAPASPMAKPAEASGPAPQQIVPHSKRDLKTPGEQIRVIAKSQYLKPFGQAPAAATENKPKEGMHRTLVAKQILTPGVAPLTQLPAEPIGLNKIEPKKLKKIKPNK